MNYSTLLHAKKKPPSSIQVETQQTGVSDLTFVAGTECAIVANDEDNTLRIVSSGRKKGSTIAAKCKMEATVHEAITMASNLCFVEYQNAMMNDTIVSPGTYAKIIKEAEVEETNGLETNTIKLKTVKSRIKRNNTSAFALRRTSPLSEVERLIEQNCQQLSEMGAPLTRDQVIGIADDTILGKKHYHKLLEYMKTLGLKVPNSIEDGGLIDTRW